MMALKSARLLDNANKVVVDLDANQNAITGESVASLRELQKSIVLLGETAQHTDQTLNGKEIQQILSNVDKGTASLASSSAHVDAATRDVAEQVHSITHPENHKNSQLDTARSSCSRFLVLRRIQCRFYRGSEKLSRR
jgi:ribosomal protein L12E/L44/L45/RPP1/RPP2